MASNTTTSGAPRVRIALADDHAATLRHIERILSFWYDVAGAVQDGPSLLELTERLSPDVVIVDIDMPGLTGLEVTSELRRRESPCRILILTVSDDPDVMEEALALGASGYVVKTHMVSELVPAIEAILEGKTFVSAGVSHEA